MVQDSPGALDAVFRALADPTRRAMLRQLTAGEQSITALAAPFEMSFAGASKHLRALEGAGLVARTVRGRTHMFALRPAALGPAHDWIAYYEQFWNARLDALEAMFRKPRKDSPR
jgi:DNA-binding transcriptional ArsR family regulator